MSLIKDAIILSKSLKSISISLNDVGDDPTHFMHMVAGILSNSENIIEVKINYFKIY